MGYLLSALPDSLTTKEVALLQEKLPEAVRPRSASQPPAAVEEETSVTFTGLEGTHKSKSKPQVISKYTQPERSCLHRLLASGIIQFFLLLQFLIPYIKVLLYHLYRYERSHHITERVVATTLDVADSLGKGGVSLGSAILRLNEGKVGAAVSDLAGWWVEGVAGGVYEGVGEGMMILGVLKSNGNSTGGGNGRSEVDGVSRC